MSSERRVEPCGEVQAEEPGPEGERGDGAGEAAAANPCYKKQPAGKPERQEEEEEEEEESLSPDQSGMQEMMSGGGLEQVQREEVQKRTEGETKRVDHTTVSQERPDRASGGGLVEQYLRRSLPRGLTNCSCPNRDMKRQVEEPRGPGMFYFFGGSNGAEIVSSYCEGRGWRRIYSKHREDFKLKWCETKSTANYCNFRQGEQLMFQIPNNKVLTTKIGLLSSLREYERVSSKVNHGRGLRRLKMEEFIPTTFRMDIREEREAFFAQHEGVSNNQSDMWICKPTGLNQGRGIFLLKSQEDVSAFRLKLRHLEDSQANRKLHCRQPQALIVQQYIRSPLLLNRRKFDVRSYLLIACTAPYMVFFRHGYVRLTCDPYDPNSNNLTAHLTNQYMQKKNPLYSQLKEDTVWSMESFNAYVNDRFQVAKDLPRDWVLGTFAKRMQQIMTQCFLAVKSKLDCRLGLFDLIGCDFMVDEDFTVWLLEMNCNPALHTNCTVLKEVIPSTVVEALELTLEIFNKCRLRKKILPLASQREFLLLYQGVYPPGDVLPCRNSSTVTNCEFNQIATRKIQKFEPRRCKSGLQRNILPPASVDTSVNTLASDEGKGSARPTTSTSPLSSPSVQITSHLNSTHMSKNKNVRPRVEMKLSKCSLHHHLKTKEELQHSKGQQKKEIIVTLCCDSKRDQIKGTPNSASVSAEVTPTQLHGGRPLCVDECTTREELVVKQSSETIQKVQPQDEMRNCDAQYPNGCDMRASSKKKCKLQTPGAVSFSEK